MRLLRSAISAMVLLLLCPGVAQAQSGQWLADGLTTAAAAESGGFELQRGGQITSTRSDTRPPGDRVGGFQVSLLGGVQLKGSASGQFGVALAWFKPPTASTGLELEAGMTNGPSGEIYHGMLSLILQSGARTSRLVPFLAVGGGVFHAREKVRDSVADALPDFGIDFTPGTETGPLITFGFGFRYYLGESTSFRADYREFRALTSGDGGFFDRLFGLRRIAGLLTFEL